MVAPGYHPLVRKQFEQVRCQQLARTRRRRRADRGLGIARLHCVDDRSRVLHIRLAVLQPDLRNCRRTRQPLELGAHARRSARHEYVLELDGCCAAEHVSSERLGAFGLLLKAQIGTGLPAEVGVLAREVHDHAMQLVSVSHDSPTARTAGPSPPWVAAYGASSAAFPFVCLPVWRVWHFWAFRTMRVRGQSPSVHVHAREQCSLLVRPWVLLRYGHTDWQQARTLLHITPGESKTY